MAAFDRAVPDPASEPPGERPVDLGRIATALRAHARAIAVAVAVVTIVAFGLALTEAQRYRATARIVADTSAGGSGSDSARRLATDLALLKSASVLDDAAARLPPGSRPSLAGHVTTATASDADVIAVTADAGDGERAAAIANAVAGAFLTQRAAIQRAAIARTRGALNAQIALLALQPDRVGDVAALRARLDDLVVQDAGAGGDLQLADAARPPSGAYAPRPLRTAVLAFLGALVVAVLIVALRERLRPAARARDLERLAGVPLLAALPALPPVSVWDRGLEVLADRAPPWLQERADGIVARRRRARATRGERVRTATEDGLRSLLAATVQALPPGSRHVILVTGAGRGQRSAQLAAGLARGLAQAGQDTLALSSDLASPHLAEALGVSPERGLSQALEQAQAGTAVRLRAVPVPGLETLHVVPGGGPPHDGVGLVRPGAVDALFAALGDTRYGYVVVDAPALLVAPEGLLVASNAEAAILAAPEQPSPEELAEVRRALERLDVRVLGVVTVPAGAAEEPEAPEAPELTAPAVTVVLPAPVAPAEAAAANGGREAGAETRLLLGRLRAADQPLTFGELREALGDAPAGRVRTRLRQLVAAGEVERRGAGRRGDPYLYGLRENEPRTH